MTEEVIILKNNTNWLVLLLLVWAIAILTAILESTLGGFTLLMLSIFSAVVALVITIGYAIQLTW